jgi:hypothetical protein
MAIGDAAADIGAVDLVESTRVRIVRDITVSTRDSEHGQQIVGRLKHLAGVRVVNSSDRTFPMHLGGKIQVAAKVPIRTRDDLSMAYTPGVPRVCLACFPGFFRGLLDSRARTVNDEMKLASVRALAGCVARGELSEEYIIPSAFNKAVARRWPRGWRERPGRRGRPAAAASTCR